MKKVVFITGTSSGFGKLTAITLAKSGYTVLAGMRGTRGKNEAVAQELAAMTNVDVIEIDVTDDACVSRAFEVSLSKYGRIDVLVNNAGITGFGLIEAYSLDQIRQLFEVNFYGVIRTYQAVLPAMRKAKSGLIINLTSGASAHALPFMGPYFATKFSVETITEAIQDELAQFNIENVTIQSGVYPTEMGVKPGTNADRAEVAQAYEPIATDMFNTLMGGLLGKMQEHKMNPQTIADGILELIAMPDGTRPLRFPLDAIAEGTDVDFIKARADFKTKWLARYNL